MMMRWYRENPKDGMMVARSISVGLPPEDASIQATNTEHQE